MKTPDTPRPSSREATSTCAPTGEERRASPKRGGSAISTAIIASVLALAGGTGCSQVTQHNRDTVVRSRTEKTLLSDWTFVGSGTLARDVPGEPRVVTASAYRDKACTLTDIKTVDRTAVVERTMGNEERSRRMAYTMGSLGAAGAVTNIVVMSQTSDPDLVNVLGVLAGVGVYFSISLVVQIIREIEAIDTETHVGEVELREARRSRCDGGPAAHARVRLLRKRGEPVAEGVTDDKGAVRLPVTGVTGVTGGDAIFALEVDGVIFNHIEIPAPKPPAGVATPPTSAPPVTPAPSAPPVPPPHSP